MTITWKPCAKSLLRENRVLALLGPSGTGKSSLIQAGLLPRLQAGALPGSDRWAWIIARPGSDPYGRLAEAGLTGAAPGRLSASVTRWVDDHPERDRLILIMDQFEELLIEAAEHNRSAMLADLVDMIGAALPVSMVLVMRDDFYSQLAAASPRLMHVFERAFINVPAVVSRRELVSIVRSPAETVGLTLQPQLTERIVNDSIRAAPTPAQTDDGAATTVLPLLEFTLTELWERRRNGQLTHEQYDVIGGVTGGLAAWCDRAYRDLPEDQRPLARRILTSLVTPGDEAVGILPRPPDTHPGGTRRRRATYGGPAWQKGRSDSDGRSQHAVRRCCPQCPGRRAPGSHGPRPDNRKGHNRTHPRSANP